MKRGWALLGSLAFLLIAPGTVAGLLPWYISGWRMRPPLLGVTASRGVGLALVVAGVAGLVDSFVRFALHGRGTPAPVLPPQHLVVTGLYRHVRNPMYVALICVIAGQGLLLGEARVLGYGVLVWSAVHAFVIAYEEPRLRRTFGAEYEDFLAHVPRWMPRLRPWRGPSAPPPA